MNCDETYLSALAASADMLADGYRTADQFHADVIDGAHEKLKASSRNLADLAERDRAHGDASDARAYLYAEAEQRHQDRLAALAHHFGQFYRGAGKADAPHALDFVASIDGEFAAMPLPAPTPIRRVEFAGIVREAGAILSPSGAPSPIPFDGSNSRETFTGDAVAFNRLKWAGTRTLTERAADLVAVEATSGFATAPQGCPVVVETPAAYPPTEGSALRPDASEGRVDPTLAGIVAAEPIPAIPAPPAGLLADIAATLARTKGVL